MKYGRINQAPLPLLIVYILSVIFPFLFLLYPLIHLDMPDNLHRVFSLHLKIMVHQLFFIGGDSGGINELEVTLGCRVAIVNFNTLLLGLGDQ
jgi:hypothetical protein